MDKGGKVIKLSDYRKRSIKKLKESLKESVISEYLRVRGKEFDRLFYDKEDEDV